MFLAAALYLALGAQADSTLRLDVTGTKVSAVDVPPLTTSKTSPETPGDQVIAVSKIRGGASGRRYLTCAATQKAPSVEQGLYACQMTYVLSKGTQVAPRRRASAAAWTRELTPSLRRIAAT